MIKRGVTRRGPFADRALAREAAHRAWFPFAFTILQEIARDHFPADDPLIERLYRALGAGDGVWKITRAGRFSRLDAMICADLAKRFPGSDPLVVHDMAASNGITAMELYQRLATGRPVAVTASDYYDRLYLVAVPKSGWTVVFDVDGTPLQYVGHGFVISGRRRELWRHVVNRGVQSWLERSILPRAAALLESAFAARDGHTRACPALESCSDSVSTVSLFHPRCIALAECDPGFTLRRHNLFIPNPVACHAVRAMNVLTPRHFEQSRIESGIRACVQNLAEGGLLILGRSIDEEDGRTAATAFEWTGSRLCPAWDLHEGSELRESLSEFEFHETSAYATR